MPTFIKAGFWEQTCRTCKGYNGWLNLDQFMGGTGTSGTSGLTGTSGISGSAGTSGSSATSGISGSSGTSGVTGTSGLSGDRYRTESVTEFTLGSSGSLIIGTGLAYTTAQDIIISYDSTHHQVSIVISYDSGTGVLVFSAPSETTGTGTYSDWIVNLSGAAGGNGSSGTSGISGSGFTAQTVGQSFVTDCSLVGSNIYFYIADVGAFAVGNFINIADTTSGSTFYYYGRITLIQFAGGFGWAIHMDVLSCGGTPVSSPSSSWLMELTGATGTAGSSGVSGTSGVSSTTYYGSFLFDSDTALTAEIPNPSSTATINVVDTTGFNSPGYFKVDSEIIGYTGKTLTTFTGITRGAAGSTASSHINGSPISQAQAAVANTPTQVLLDQTDLSNGVTLSGLGNVTVANAGVYNLQFSIQIQNFSNDYEDTAIWFRVNGNDIPQSASYITSTQVHAGTPDANLATVNIFYTLAANDVVSLAWLSKGGHTAITSVAPVGATLPVSPGVIFTVNKIA